MNPELNNKKIKEFYLHLYELKYGTKEYIHNFTYLTEDF